MNEEQIRAAIGAAYIQSRCGEDDGPDVLEWHHCFDQPGCPGNWRSPAGCGCTGVAYISQELWVKLAPVIEEIVRKAQS